MLIGCGKKNNPELDQHQALSQERDFRFRAQVLPVILDDLDVLGYCPIYLTYNRQFSPENTAFMTDGIVTDHFVTDIPSDANTNVVGKFTVQTYYRGKDMQPSTLQLGFDFDVARLNDKLKAKGLSPHQANVLEKILDPKAKTVTIWKDVICDLGPIEKGRRKVAINATWPIAYKGDRYPYNGREVYDFDMKVSGAAIRHIVQKVLTNDCVLAVQPHYTNNPSKVEYGGRGLVRGKGFILVKDKIVGSFSFNNGFGSDKKPLITCSIRFKEGYSSIIRSEIQVEASSTATEIKEPDQIDKPFYRLSGNELNASLPLNADMRQVVGDAAPLS